jgi:hypothetical protein
VDLVEEKGIESRSDNGPDELLLPAGRTSPPDGLPSGLTKRVTQTLIRERPQVGLIHHSARRVVSEPATCEIRYDSVVANVRNRDGQQIAVSAQLAKQGPWIVEMLEHVGRNDKVEVTEGIPVDVFHPGRHELVVSGRKFGRAGIVVDPDQYLGTDLSKARGQRAFPTPDVEHTPGCRSNEVEQVNIRHVAANDRLPLEPPAPSRISRPYPYSRSRPELARTPRLSRTLKPVEPTGRAA